MGTVLTIKNWLSLKRGKGNRRMGMENGNGKWGTGNGERGIFKMGNLKKRESFKRGIFKSGNL